MTMRLDLRTRKPLPDWPAPILVRPDCYGCADCETWFQFAWQLLAHDCEARDACQRIRQRATPYSDGYRTGYLIDADLLDGDGDAR